MRKKNILLFFVIALVFFLIGCNKTTENKNDTNISVDKNDKRLLYFKEYHKEKIIMCAQEDLNNDGKKDLVVIYNKGKEKNGMIVVLTNKNDRYKLTNEVPAPIENQKVDFKDIDNKPPMEFTVSGSKNGNFGYAIYRIEKDKIVDLFGEDMHSCC